MKQLVIKMTLFKSRGPGSPPPHPGGGYDRRDPRPRRKQTPPGNPSLAVRKRAQERQRAGLPHPGGIAPFGTTTGLSREEQAGQVSSARITHIVHILERGGMGVELRRRRKKTGVVVPIDGSAPGYNLRGSDYVTATTRHS